MAESRRAVPRGGLVPALLALLFGALAAFVTSVAAVQPSSAAVESGGGAVDAPAAVELRVLLDAELEATTRALALYSRKRQLLAAKAAHHHARAQPRNATKELADGGGQTTRARTSTSHGHRVFSDWLGLFNSTELNATRFALGPDRHGDLVQMVAFNSNSKPMGRSPHPASPRKPTALDPGAPLLQFLAVMERKTATLHLHHPTTHELVWQAALPEIRDLAAFSLASDRRAHLALLTRAGQLALYSVRIWHHGRAVAGGFRRVDPLGPHQCILESFDRLAALSWATPPVPQASPAPGKHLHIDVELVFRTTALHGRSASSKARERTAPARQGPFSAGGVVVTSKFRHNVVVASDNRGALYFFHAENGSFAGGLEGRPLGDPLALFAPMAGGILALATRRHVRFVDVSSRRELGAVCDAGPSARGITSLRADPKSPLTVYAGLSSGRGLVFRLRHVRSAWHAPSSDDDRPRRPECVLVDQLRPRRPQDPAQSQREPQGAGQEAADAAIAVLPGYLVLGAGSRLVLFQLAPGESSRPLYLSEREFAPAGPSDPAAECGYRVAAVDAATSVAEHPAALTVHLSSSLCAARRVAVFASLQPPAAPASLNLSWVRFPAVLFCVVAALFWQQRAKAGAIPPHPHDRSLLDDRSLSELLGGGSARADWPKSSFSTNQRARRRF